MDIDRKKFDAMCREWKVEERTETSIIKNFKITGTTFYRKVKGWKL